MYFNGTKGCLVVLFTILSLSLKAVPTPIPTYSGNCIGQPIYLYANPDTTVSSPITYVWSGPSGFTSTQQNPVIPIASAANTGYYYLYDIVEGVTSSMDSIFIDVLPTTPVSISITASPNDTICQGANVSFTAITTTGGISPTYQWRINGSDVVGAVSGMWAAPTLSDGDQITCVLHSNLVCPTPVPAVSNVITLEVVNNTPIAHIFASAGPSVPAGSSVSFTSVTFNGGPGAVYQWVHNGTPVAGADSSTFTLPSVTTVDTVSMIITSSLDCATPNFANSNTIIVHAHTAGIGNTGAIAGIDLFPNPSNGSFTLSGDLSYAGDVNVEAINTLGQTVYASTLPSGMRLSTTIDLSAQPAGIYMLRVSQNGASRVMRFTIQH